METINAKENEPIIETTSETAAQPLTALYVGELDERVTEEHLKELFNQIGDVESVKIYADQSTEKYGFVNYTHPQHAAKALEVLNFTLLYGTHIIIAYSDKDGSQRNTGLGNIFVKNLDKEIDHKDMHDTFSPFGKILSWKIVTNSSGQSLGYGFVHYGSEESAQKAIEMVNGMVLNGKQVFVGPFLRKQERDMLIDKTKFTNVFVKNLSEITTVEDVHKAFGEFGAITSAVVMRNEDGTSKRFGFVNFVNTDDAARAVESLNGKTIDNKKWFVGRAQKKSEREIELRNRFEQDRSQGLNLYIKNFDDSIEDEEFKGLFSPFGSITSCKVMRDPNGGSKGFGFVAFSSPEETAKALYEMKGKIILGKPLYVTFAQRKEDRRARLQAQFAQLNLKRITMGPSVAARMPMYPPGLGQQIFYGQSPPAIRPLQFIPDMRPVRPLMLNMPGGWRGNVGPIQRPQPVPIMQQQMVPRGHGNRYERESRDNRFPCNW